MKAEKKGHVCPFCEEEIAEASYPFCQTCKIEVLKCPGCGKALSREVSQCPNCGTKIGIRRSKKGN